MPEKNKNNLIWEIKKVIIGFIVLSVILVAIDIIPKWPGKLKVHSPDSLFAGTNNGDLFDEPDEKIDEMLDNMAKTNLRVLRIFVDLRLEMDANGDPLPVGTYDDCLLEAIDDMMFKASKKGILLFITLHQYNWIHGTSLPISEDFYSWRKCKTPVDVYEEVTESGVGQSVYDPYYLRGWSDDYLVNSAAKDAYKRRVEHILNHVNPHFKKPWKDINDVIWAWGLQNEPEYLLSSASGDDDLKDWLSEMATYVKSIDSNTYVALGTKYYDEDLGNITDADIYTINAYGYSPSALGEDIRSFKESIGEPFHKLLLIQELNPGAMRRHTPGNHGEEWTFEALLEEIRKNNVPWMFWEYGYLFDDDDIWHRNSVTMEDDDPIGRPDGIFWGAKILPASHNIWKNMWNWVSVGKKWKVREKVTELCSKPGADCDLTPSAYFIDTFTDDSLSGGHRWFDENNPDSYDLEGGYLKISAGLWQDLWGGIPLKRGAPIILRPAPEEENYTITTFVRADDPSEMRAWEPIPYPSQARNSQIGLFVFQDVNNWIFFGLTDHDFTVDGSRVQGDGLIVTKTEDDSSSIVEQSTIFSDFMFLKIKKTGDNWKFYSKTEYAENWQILADFDMRMEDHEIGIGVKTFDIEPLQGSEPAKAYFDFLSIEP